MQGAHLLEKLAHVLRARAGGRLIVMALIHSTSP